MTWQQPKPRVDPEPKAGIIPGDELYVHHPTAGPCVGKVLAHGKHGVTVDVGGKPHRATWDKVLGHKKRIAQHMDVVDTGEDGMLVADAQGKHHFIATPNEAKEDPLVAKAFVMDGRLMMLKAGPLANRPGLAQKDVTDKNGVTSKRWVRTNKPQPKGREPGAKDQPEFKPPHAPGDKVHFKAGDFSGAGEVVGTPGRAGAHVKDASGRIHKIRYSEISHAQPAGADPAAPAQPVHLFNPEDMASLPLRVDQPAKTWEELVTKGSEGLEQFKGQLSKVAEAMKLQSGKKPEQLTPEDWHSDEGFLFVAPLKSEARAREKVESDYGGDWSQLRDVVRATISVPQLANVTEALSHLKSVGIELAQKPKDRFSKPTDEGYRDLMTIVKLPNGMLAELQIHVKAMTLAKEEGHEHYNVTRSLYAKYGEGAPSEKWSPEDKSRFDAAFKAQREIYDTVWSKASGAVPVDEKKPLHKSESVSKMIIFGRQVHGLY